MRNLLIDDDRDVRFVETNWGFKITNLARSFQEGIMALKRDGPFDTLLLDHDLASYDSERSELTGYHVMLFLEENPKYLPKNIVLVTSNPVGRKRMQAIIDNLYSKNKVRQWEK